MTMNGARKVIEVLDAHNRLAANRNTTVQLPYRLSSHEASGRDVGRTPFFEVVVRKLEHSDALLC